MGFLFTLELLKEAGGRASVEQLRKMAKAKDPGNTGNTINHLRKLRTWSYADFDKKTNTWYIIEAKQ